MKEAVLPFKRFRTKDGQTVDSVLGPEMRSTGEVMGIDRDFPRAFAKSQEAAYGGMPLSGTVFISVADSDKRAVILPAHRLQELGFTLVATEGTAEILARNGIAVEVVNKYSATRSRARRNIVDLINAGEIDIVVNTPSGRSARADGYEIRAAAVAADKALFTTMAVLGAAVSAFDAVRAGLRRQEPAGVRGRPGGAPVSGAPPFGERVRGGARRASGRCASASIRTRTCSRSGDWRPRPPARASSDCASWMPPPAASASSSRRSRSSSATAPRASPPSRTCWPPRALPA